MGYKNEYEFKTNKVEDKDMKGIGEKVSRKAAECCIHPMEESNSAAIG